MNAREYIALLAGTAAVWPHSVRAQRSERMRRVGMLLPASAEDAQFQTWVGAFLQALQRAWDGRLDAMSRSISDGQRQSERIRARGGNGRARA